MIQREEKRSRLFTKYSVKRASLKEELKSASDYEVKLDLYKKIESLPKSKIGTFYFLVASDHTML